MTTGMQDPGKGTPLPGDAGSDSRSDVSFDAFEVYIQAMNRARLFENGEKNPAKALLAYVCAYDILVSYGLKDAVRSKDNGGLIGDGEFSEEALVNKIHGLEMATDILYDLTVEKRRMAAVAAHEAALEAPLYAGEAAMDTSVFPAGFRAYVEMVVQAGAKKISGKSSEALGLYVLAHDYLAKNLLDFDIAVFIEYGMLDESFVRDALESSISGLKRTLGKEVVLDLEEKYMNLRKMYDAQPAQLTLIPV